eukprot:2696947-Rhodomonas_salina.1
MMVQEAAMRTQSGGQQPWYKWYYRSVCFMQFDLCVGHGVPAMWREEDWITFAPYSVHPTTVQPSSSWSHPEKSRHSCGKLCPEVASQLAKVMSQLQRQTQ